jgi:hypothetical protein
MHPRRNRHLSLRAALRAATETGVPGTAIQCPSPGQRAPPDGHNVLMLSLDVEGRLTTRIPRAVAMLGSLIGAAVSVRGATPLGSDHDRSPGALRGPAA